MKKTLIVIQALFVILIVVYLVFTFSRTNPSLTDNKESWSSWEGFSALSYQGITSAGEEGYVSRGRLKEHLQALKQAGYNTITPEDALAFLEHRAPLPEKALMLMFEGGRKDSFIYSTPLLRKLGMRATMCVPTGFTGEWGAFYLKKNDLKGLSGQEHWSLCSMGDRAMSEIPVDRAGTKGHFLSRRMWLGNDLEKDAAFKERVTKDYAGAAHFLEQISGKKIQTYLYPYADTGTGALADPIAFEINRKSVSEYHGMAFTAAEDPFNGLSAAPYSLNRLRVGDNWDGNYLLNKLRKSMPVYMPVRGFRDENWVKMGGIAPDGNILTLSHGASLWMRGSNHWSDFDITVKARQDAKASLALFGRYNGADSFLKLTIIRTGILLYERQGAASQMLARVPLAESNDEYTVRLRVKGNRAWIWRNNRPVASSVPLSSGLVMGKIGMSSQSGEIRLLEFQAEPFKKVFALADGYRLLPPSRQREVSALIPWWFSPGAPPRITAQQRMDALIAASSGVKTMPLIKTDKDMTAEAAEKFVKSVISSLEQNSVKPLVTHIAVSGPGGKLHETLHKYGFRLIRILSPDNALRSVKDNPLMDGDLILVKGQGEKMEGTIKGLLHFSPPDRLIIQADAKTDLPYGVSAAIDFTGETKKGVE